MRILPSVSRSEFFSRETLSFRTSFHASSDTRTVFPVVNVDHRTVLFSSISLFTDRSRSIRTNADIYRASRSNESYSDRLTKLRRLASQSSKISYSIRARRAFLFFTTRRKHCSFVEPECGRTTRSLKNVYFGSVVGIGTRVECEGSFTRFREHWNLAKTYDTVRWKYSTQRDQGW